MSSSRLSGVSSPHPKNHHKHHHQKPVFVLEDMERRETTTDTDAEQERRWWMEAVDPHSGQPYFYHAVTRETSWHKPSTSSTKNQPRGPTAAAANTLHQNHHHNHVRSDASSATSSSVFDGVGSSVASSIVAATGAASAPSTPSYFESLLDQTQTTVALDPPLVPQPPQPKQQYSTTTTTTATQTRQPPSSPARRYPRSPTTHHRKVLGLGGGGRRLYVFEDDSDDDDEKDDQEDEDEEDEDYSMDFNMDLPYTTTPITTPAAATRRTAVESTRATTSTQERHKYSNNNNDDDYVRQQHSNNKTKKNWSQTANHVVAALLPKHPNRNFNMRMEDEDVDDDHDDVDQCNDNPPMDPRNTYHGTMMASNDPSQTSSSSFLWEMSSVTSPTTATNLATTNMASVSSPANTTTRASSSSSALFSSSWLPTTSNQSSSSQLSSSVGLNPLSSSSLSGRAAAIRARAAAAASNDNTKCSRSSPPNLQYHGHRQESNKFLVDHQNSQTETMLYELDYHDDDEHEENDDYYDPTNRKFVVRLPEQRGRREEEEDEEEEEEDDLDLLSDEPESSSIDFDEDDDEDEGGEEEKDDSSFAVMAPASKRHENDDNGDHKDQNEIPWSSSSPPPYFFSFPSSVLFLFGMGSGTNNNNINNNNHKTDEACSRVRSGSCRSGRSRLRSPSVTSAGSSSRASSAAIIPRRKYQKHMETILLTDPMHLPEDYYGVNNKNNNKQLQDTASVDQTLDSNQSFQKDNTTDNTSNQRMDTTTTLPVSVSCFSWKQQPPTWGQKRRKRRLMLAGAVLLGMVFLIVLVSLLTTQEARKKGANIDNNDNNTNNKGKENNDDEENNDDWMDQADEFRVIEFPLDNVTEDHPLDCARDLNGSDLALLIWPNNMDDKNDDEDENNNTANTTKPFDLYIQFSASDSLCMLVRTKVNSTTWVPLARSYYGHAWEPYAPNPRYPIDCSSRDEMRNSTRCVISLVSPDDPWKRSASFLSEEGNPQRQRKRRLLQDADDDGGPWYFALATSNVNHIVTTTLDPVQQRRDEYARFLEQTTFGTTRAGLNTLMQRHDAKANTLENNENEGNSNNGGPSTAMMVMAEWIQEQMTAVPATLHREIFRTHANVRFASSSPTGQVTHPCQAWTAYRRFVFVEPHSQKQLDISTTEDNQYRLLKIDNVVLTVLPNTDPIQMIETKKRWNKIHVFVDGSYEICGSPEMFLGGRVWLVHPDDDSCKWPVQFGPFPGNPPIQFDNGLQEKNINIFPVLQVMLPENSVQPMDTAFYASKDSTSSVQRLLIKQPLTDNICSQLKYNSGGPVPIVFGLHQQTGEYWVHDPRFVLQENSLSRPLVDGGGTLVEETASDNPYYQATCANVARTWQNEDSCYLSLDPNVCGAANNRQSVELTLNETTLKLFYNLTATFDLESARYVYAVNGLRINDDTETPPPCQPMARSRWIPVSGSTQDICQTLGSQTNKVLANLIANHSDGTEFIRDIFFPARSSIAACNVTDLKAKDFEVWAVDTCWHNVHPNHGQVYDMTGWLDKHPGGPDKIAQFASSGNVWLTFPPNHDMQRWQDYRDDLFFDFGRFGETIDFHDDLSNLPLQLDPSIRQFFLDENDDSLLKTTTAVGTVVCGSPGEVANDLALDGEEFRGAYGITTKLNNTSRNRNQEKETIWLTTVLTANDQLRQRMAWALSQILIVDFASNLSTRTEAFVHYYDIFVRHAFGNYRDIVKDVAYNVLMGRMLTYTGSKSLGYSWRRNEGLVEHPDENFAREVMQLFTIGLNQLNIDGSEQLDEEMRAIRTYANDDIMEYSRVWTGFERQSPRGNKDDATDNRVDPMNIRVAVRDMFPKMGLNQKYIGDGYPLCSDLPPRHFLKQGAKYLLLGSNPFPELQPDNHWDSTAVRFVADPSGPLNAILCGGADDSSSSNSSSNCTYPSKVILHDNLVCVGQECEVDTVRVVQVEGGIYYEYVQPPCVHQAFLENPRKIKKRNRGAGQGVARYMCADPRTTVASPACCFNNSDSYVYEAYWGERVLASTAEKRCAEQAKKDVSMAMCTSTDALNIKNCKGSSCAGPNLPFYWFAKEVPCSIKAKLGDSDKIAVVHTVPGEDSSQRRDLGQEDEDNKTFFRVQFYNGKDEIAELVKTCNTTKGCSVAEDGYCLCDVAVENEQVYFSVPTREEVLLTLTVGSFHPDNLDGAFSLIEARGDVKVHADEAQFGNYSTETIFEVMDDFGLVQFRKNVRSTVEIIGTTITFRNPVHFISLAEPTLRDAQYETDAAIDQYLYHKNTGPFVATRLVQRFGISNPSPRYVRAVAEAFQKGKYSYLGDGLNILFGEGLHGDLAATVAAILLDPEARSVILDADPAFGSLKEPLLKVTGLMRNLEFQQTPDSPFPILKKNIQETIGQMIYEAPSIFSFFLPEFQPSGRVANAGLMSPEAEVYSAPNIIGTMNGLLAMIKYGLDQCFNGFGETPNWSEEAGCQWRIPGQYVNMSGYPGFSPTDSSTREKIVDELATLMTSGRINEKLRHLIVNATNSQTNSTVAAIQLQQLISGTSEFHSNGRTRKSGKARDVPNEVVPSKKPYKALVVLMLAGGYDSYNLLVPQNCSGTNDKGMTIVEQYTSERGEIGLKTSERELVVDVEGQPCDKFAVHKSIPVVQELYNQGDLSFFLNAGMINKAPTKKTYEAVTSTQLFAHNAMRHEAQTIDPYHEIDRTGVLGRLAHLLNSDKYGYHAQRVSINNLFPAVNGDESHSAPPIVMSQHGPQKFNDKPTSEEFDPLQYFELLNGQNYVQSNLFGEYWSDAFVHALAENEFLADLLKDVTLEDSCGSDALNMVVQLMETRIGRGMDRDLFYLSVGKWDHHSNVKSQLDAGFKDLNDALICYMKNLKSKGLWNNATLLVVSEFGRTLTPNTNLGSDHGWAGHYFALGGALDGGKVFGDYPTDLTDDGPLNVGRGRLIPTLSWESIYTPLCEWLGLSIGDCEEYVLPNSQRTGTTMLREEQVFRSDIR
ncbi:hypothetical protein ACA910_011978 [Epithemia clementina (nom. ined.)]